MNITPDSYVKVSKNEIFIENEAGDLIAKIGFYFCGHLSMCQKGMRLPRIAETEIFYNKTNQFFQVVKFRTHWAFIKVL